MSATSPDPTCARGDGVHERRTVRVRRSTETKASFKTTEFIPWLAMLAGLFIAGAVGRPAAVATTTTASAPTGCGCTPSS